MPAEHTHDCPKCDGYYVCEEDDCDMDALCVECSCEVCGGTGTVYAASPTPGGGRRTAHPCPRGCPWRCPECWSDADGCYCAEDAEPLEESP